VSFSTHEDFAWYLGWIGLALVRRFAMCPTRYWFAMCHPRYWFEGFGCWLEESFAMYPSRYSEVVAQKDNENEILGAHWKMNDSSNWSLVHTQQRIAQPFLDLKTKRKIKNKIK
jgi:hypothetical protein